MPQIARIKLSSLNLAELEQVVAEIKDIAEKQGSKIAGPIPLPTKRLRVVTRKSPCGEGTHTFDRWEIRIHSRLIDVVASDRLMRQIMRIKVPDTVKIEIKLLTS
ncbi:MAG: 30S ribosomal protein S10 [Thermoprotei archaeon]|jgi:small subunit ribosomal protein S10